MYFHITVTVCIQGGCSPLSAKYCTNSSESASPSHLLAHFTNHLPRAPPLVSILVLPSPQKAVRSQPCYDSRSSCKQTWVQMTEPQLPLSSTVGKRKVHKVAQLPCHNLGRAGIAAEVVCAAPQREGVPAITHQEVPNQLRRDADRLWCTFLFFFSFSFSNPQRKMLGHSINELVPLFQIHMKAIIPGSKKSSPHGLFVNLYHWQEPIPQFLFTDDSKVIRSE